MKIEYDPFFAVFGTVLVMVLGAGFFQWIGQDGLQAMFIIMTILFGGLLGYVPAHVKNLIAKVRK